MTLDLSWRIAGPGSADLVMTLPDTVIKLHTTYVGDGLSSLLRAATDLAMGSGSALAFLEREPGGTSLHFSGTGADVYMPTAGRQAAP